MNIPLFKIDSDTRDIQAITKVIRRGSEWALGKELVLFEKKLAGYINTRYAVAFNSGTSALHALLLAHGIGQGDEVIVPSFTFIATANAPKFVGAIPVFADIEEKTYALDPEDVEKKITTRTKAIIVVHYAGCPASKTLELKKIAKKHGLLLFEDAAESMGAEVNGKKTGSIGDAGILSFCQNKIITTGEGGAVVTNSEKIYHSLKLICSQGRNETESYFTSTKKPDYISLGYNFRMSSLIAALGISQLQKIDRLIQNRVRVAKQYNHLLSSLEQIKLPHAPETHKQVYQMYTIRVPSVIRDKLQKYLLSQGIFSKVYFEPIHETGYYQSFKQYQTLNLPNTISLSREVLSLPIFPGMTLSQIQHVAKHIRDFFNKI